VHLVQHQVIPSIEIEIEIEIICKGFVQIGQIEIEIICKEKNPSS
jgi:hypothetical protein